MAEVSELFTLVDADAVGRVDLPCKDETGMHSDKYTCFTDLARWLSECVALSFDATCLEDASTLTATEKKITLSVSFFVCVFEFENATSRRSIRYCSKNDTV